MYPNENVDDKLTEAINAIGGSSVVGRYSINEKDFVNAIGQHHFRGTSKLVRVPKTVFSEISRALATKFMKRSSGQASGLASAVPTRKYNDVCPTCFAKTYNIGKHVVGVDISGNVKVIKKLETLAETPTKGEDTGADGAKEKDEKSAETQSPTAAQYSIDCVFRPFSTANAMAKCIRAFAKNKGTVARPLGLLHDKKEDFYKLLLQFYHDLCVHMDAEFKCQKVYSPCYIIGDIHGNLEDILTIEKSVWPLMPIVGPNFVFLGDYVDRGQWGMECALYVAAIKMLCPGKVTMMRGNHEVRSLQKHYSYLKECIIKYGEEYGLKIFELTNRIFDRLPVCSVVDDAIFCAHGGLPFSAKTLDQIVAVKKNIREPEQESDIAWEILWSGR